MVANQLIYCLNYIYSRQIIYQNIKPENIFMGVRRRENHVYITDMGISMKYISLKADYTVPKNTSLVGSPLFAYLWGRLRGSEWREC